MANTQERQGDPSPPRWEFGDQSLWEAAPDVIRMNLVGTVDGPDLSAIYAKTIEWSKDKPYWITVVDVSRFVTSTPSSRSVVFAQTPNPKGTTVMYGVSFAIRMLIDLTMRAKKRLKPHDTEEIVMVKSEAEAWAEVERIRASKASKVGGVEALRRS